MSLTYNNSRHKLRFYRTKIPCQPNTPSRYTPHVVLTGGICAYLCNTSFIQHTAFGSFWTVTPARNTSPQLVYYIQRRCILNKVSATFAGAALTITALSSCSPDRAGEQAPQAVIVEQPSAPINPELTAEQRAERDALIGSLDYIIPCPEEVTRDKPVATAFSTHSFSNEPAAVTFGRIAFEGTSAIWFTASQTGQGSSRKLEIVRHAKDYRMTQPPTNEAMGTIYPSEIPTPTPDTEIFPALTDSKGFDSYVISIRPNFTGGSLTLRATCTLTHNGITGLGGQQPT